MGVGNGDRRRSTALPTTTQDENTPNGSNNATKWNTPSNHLQERDHNNRASSTLHHRVRRTGSGDQAADEFEKGLQSQQRYNKHYSGNGTSAFKGTKAKRKRFRCGQWIRTCLLAGIPAYLLLIFLFLKRLNHQRAIENHGTTHTNNNNNDHAVYDIRDLHASIDWKGRVLLDEQEWGEQSDMGKQIDEQTIERKGRTQPPPLGNIDDDLEIAQVYTIPEHERPIQNHHNDVKPTLVRPSKLEELCGFQAQNAALEEPSSYTYRDALKMPKSRITRVLITGILSQPAYLLALALKERCNVQVIIGFDSMYPNSLRNRLRLQEQMAILTKYIPKLVRPIFVSHSGIDPLKHSRNFQVFAPTQEVDILRTLTPTHIVHFGNYDPAVHKYTTDPEWINSQSPYVADEGRPNHEPSLLPIRSGMLSMEQILASIAQAPESDRPHFLYASASPQDKTMHSWSRQLDEVMADYYHQRHGLYSVGIRLPNTVYGPWGHPESLLYQLIDTTAQKNANLTAPLNAALASDMSNLDLLHVDDVVDGLIAAMQYRPQDAKPAVFDFTTDERLSLRGLQEVTKKVLDTTQTEGFAITPVKTQNQNFIENREVLKRTLGWAPRVPLVSGVARTIAWHLDRLQPYGPPLRSNQQGAILESGDSLLQRHSVATCAPGHIACHGSRPYLPCASECSVHDQCVKTIFDDIVPLVQELTEECDIVLYTHNFDKNAKDLTLQSEFMEEGDPLICNFAFINGESELVNTVIGKVPDDELSKLGFEMTPEDENLPGGIEARKHEKLNGRLLYRGWILIWTKDTPETLPSHEKYLLKLSPGRLFHADVTSAVYIDQEFGVSPTADDIKFLVHEMHRKPWSSRVVKRKTRPKAKFLLPAEPRRQAVVLMSELKFQDSKDAERLSPDERISTYEATRFMRFSNGEETLGREPPDIKLQREFYDRLRTSINPDHSRGPAEPMHKFEMKHWVRSRWVAHDFSHEESRQLRCEWYQEHILWQTNLDQLSFAYVMEKLELDRKLTHNEPDEVIQKHLSEKTEMKKLLSDTFEWHALKTEQNKLYSPYEEMQILPYDMDYTEERQLSAPAPDYESEDLATPLFVRIISDRIMAYARKAWNSAKTGSSKDEL